VEAFT